MHGDFSAEAIKRRLTLPEAARLLVFAVLFRVAGCEGNSAGSCLEVIHLGAFAENPASLCATWNLAGLKTVRWRANNATVLVAACPLRRRQGGFASSIKFVSLRRRTGE